ncbi:MAG: hypothetical protein JSW18_02220 [Candidatus Omnitrophota bacterium]|nr:MAG: hypothetical protein JSW18_02220 [Candidatus Omnitrophota bacterium]
MNKTILSAILVISLLITGCAVGDDGQCSDGIKNQDETDIDCGGSCDPCANGKACSTDDDCVNKCSTNKVCYTPATSTGSTTRTTTATAEVSDDVRTKIEGQLKPNIMEAVSVYPYFKSMRVGEGYTYGIGVVNVFAKELIFKIVLEFDKAIDKSSNTIQEVDPSYVNDWLDKTEFAFRLGQGEQEILALPVKVGSKVAENVPTKTGNYIWTVRVLYGDDPTVVDDKYASKETLTIRVP